MNGLSPKKRETPWAIRGVSLEARNAAVAAARRDDVTLGGWLERAIRQQVKADRNQAVGPTIEETLAKLAESMARQAEATQQQNAAMAARLEAMEQREQEKGVAIDRTGGNLFMRVYGMLARKQGTP